MFKKIIKNKPIEIFASSSENYKKSLYIIFSSEKLITNDKKLSSFFKLLLFILFSIFCSSSFCIISFSFYCSYYWHIFFDTGSFVN